jgi:uncharacterized membrane protein YidH (DUF202 family)
LMQDRTVLAASAFSAIMGAAGIVGSVGILLLFSANTIYSIPFVGQLFKAFIGQTLYLGIFVIAASLAHIAVGYLLWKRKKEGGYLGYALSGAEILIYLSIFLYPNLALPLVASLGLGSALYVLILMAWDGLH